MKACIAVVIPTHSNKSTHQNAQQINYNTLQITFTTSIQFSKTKSILTNIVKLQKIKYSANVIFLRLQNDAGLKNI